MAAFIYRVTNTITNDSYVGQTRHSIERRYYRHLWLSGHGSETHFHRAIRLYGDDVFILESLETIEDVARLTEREQYWISLLHPKYNMTSGGEGGSPSTEVREKLRQAKLRNWASPSYRERQRQNHVGFSGRKHRPESNAKRSHSLKGRAKTPEHRQKLREATLAWYARRAVSYHS